MSHLQWISSIGILAAFLYRRSQSTSSESDQSARIVDVSLLQHHDNKSQQMVILEWHRKRLRVPISEHYRTPQTTQASFVSSIGSCMARWYKEWRAMPQVIMLHLQQFCSAYYCRHICKFPHKMWIQRLPAVSTAYSTCNLPTGASAGSNKLLDVRVYRWPSCAARYISRQPRPLLGICKAWKLSLVLLARLWMA